VQLAIYQLIEVKIFCLALTNITSLYSEIFKYPCQIVMAATFINGAQGNSHAFHLLLRKENTLYNDCYYGAYLISKIIAK